MSQVPNPVSVGATLRAARESQGISIPQIAAELCITPSYVRAIEDGKLKNLPGLFFYKSFVRQYASLVDVAVTSLGLEHIGVEDGAVIASAPQERFATGFSSSAESSSSYRPTVRAVDSLIAETNSRYFSNHSTGLSVAALVVALIGCSGFYAWWTRIPSQSNPTVPVVTAPAVITPVQNTAPVQPTQAVEQTPAEEAPQAAVTPIVSSDQQVGIEMNGVVLDLSATENTWLSITSNGHQIFSGTLRRSESKKLAVNKATIKIGNAGGIEIRWNGKPIGPLGGRGEVRTVNFTPEAVQIVTPADRL